jgi:hypothetical protein
MKKSQIRKMIARAPMLTPTPIPALADEEMPEDKDEEGKGEDGELESARDEVLGVVLRAGKLPTENWELGFGRLGIL